MFWQCKPPALLQLSAHPLPPFWADRVFFIVSILLPSLISVWSVPSGFGAIGPSGAQRGASVVGIPHHTPRLSFGAL
ncbi:hypothetical protein B0T24DRAFT_619877 [Lasiosphaeria ovina]|uniref:Uncharacterized protein n=1 Tax=Lasiosphaeria ovina TaxID=92902 RepID=A0AAE0KIZ1_9PEZI|nr:hypothetical protein B0T24DRAFT_619877 [Lasiosphaeria ovina]